MQRMWFLMCLWGMGLTVVAAAPNEQAKQLELKGDGSGARTMLSRAAQSAGANTEDLWAYAEFLDRHGDPASREAYEKLSASLGRSAEQNKQAEVARRLVELDLVAGGRRSARKHPDSVPNSPGHALISPPA